MTRFIFSCAMTMLLGCAAPDVGPARAELASSADRPVPRAERTVCTAPLVTTEQRLRMVFARGVFMVFADVAVGPAASIVQDTQEGGVSEMVADELLLTDVEVFGPAAALPARVLLPRPETEVVTDAAGRTSGVTPDSASSPRAQALRRGVISSPALLLAPFGDDFVVSQVMERRGRMVELTDGIEVDVDRVVSRLGSP